MEHRSIYAKSMFNGSKLVENPGYQFSIQVLNDSKDDVVAMHRCNIPFKAHGVSLQTPTHNRITIRTVHTFSSLQAVTDTRNLLHERFVSMKQFISEDSRIIYDLLMGGQANQHWAAIKIDRIIQMQDLNQAGSLYVTDLDLMLYSKDYRKDLIHPYSEFANCAQEGEGVAQQHPYTAGMVIQLVDNDDKIAKRYIYLANQIVEVPIIQDKSRQSGVYVHLIDKGLSGCTRHELSDMESIGLYPTIEEAETNGKPELVHQKVVTTLKQQLETSKIENDQARVEYEAKISQIKQDHEEYVRNIERERHKTKDAYEERSYQRKSDYEGLKAGAAMLAIVLSVVAIAKKA